MHQEVIMNYAVDHRQRAVKQISHSWPKSCIQKTNSTGICVSTTETLFRAQMQLFFFFTKVLEVNCVLNGSSSLWTNTPCEHQRNKGLWANQPAKRQSTSYKQWSEEEPSMAALMYNTNTQEVEARELLCVQGRPGIYKFQANLGYKVRP